MEYNYLIGIPLILIGSILTIRMFINIKELENENNRIIDEMNLNIGISKDLTQNVVTKNENMLEIITEFKNACQHLEDLDMEMDLGVTVKVLDKIEYKIAEILTMLRNSDLNHLSNNIPNEFSNTSLTLTIISLSFIGIGCLLILWK